MKRYLKTPKEVIDVLHDGKVVINNEGCHYKMYKGVIICFWKNEKQWDITLTLSYSDDLYVDESESLNLEVGKFYKTRDGRKAWITEYRDTEYVFPFLVAAQKELAIYSVTKEGRLYSEGISGSDLVAPWEE